ncbi:MAG: tetratricopeptide repeat protein [Desulfobulbaceae bacterium]|nr:tetratricopeptide repeat protein [Desulfobulbaceae bacterium]HIJ78231.1 tetratricopeptide repeat protein [Deltaproteobacteria bacterium]
MWKRIIVMGCLMLGCISCVSTNQGVSDQPPFAAELEPYDEAVDRGCSYFNFLWGKSAELEDHYDEAIYAYKQALLCDRRAVHVMETLALLLVKTDQREQGVAWIEKIIELEPKNIGARSLLANLYSSMQRPKDAVAIYKEILAEEPRNFNVMLMLGGLYARYRQYENAQQVLEHMVELDPESYAGYYYLAKLYQELRFNVKAMAAYEKALSLNWSAMLAYETADLYEQEKNFDKAIALYRRIIEESGPDERARRYLANNYLQQGKIDEALAELEELRKEVADVDKLDFTISKILIDNGRYDAAIARLTEVLARKPDSEGARSMLVLAYYQQGDMASVKKILGQVKPGSSSYGESLLMLVKILQEEGDQAAAESLLLDAIADSAHRSLVFYVGLAMVYQQQGKVDKGHAVFKKAFVDFPDNSDVGYEYGLFLHKIDDHQGSMREMEEVIKRDPDHARALNYVGYSWAEEGRNLEQAKVYIERAVLLQPKDGFIRDSLGWVYYQQGAYGRAVEELERAVELSDDDPTIYEHLGEALLKAGNIEGARQAFGRSIELYGEDEKADIVRRKLESLASPQGSGQ